MKYSSSLVLLLSGTPPAEATATCGEEPVLSAQDDKYSTTGENKTFSCISVLKCVDN